jgi:hypothetical protein
LITYYGKQTTLEVLAVNGIKTDLWLTADKEVLPLTGQKPELQWKALRKQKGITIYKKTTLHKA